MPLLFACPHCGEQTLVDDEFAGQSGPCISCGRTLIVPRFAAPVAANPSGGNPAIRELPANFSSRMRLTMLILGGVAVAAVVMVLFSLLAAPIMEASHTATNRRKCASNLRRIGAALAAYENVYGTLPPAYTVDKEDNRLQSWRVLILPYLGPEEKALYQQFHLNEPWNSQHNSAIAAQMPALYRSPGDETPNSAIDTSYIVIDGKRTAFPGSKSIPLGRITDGPQLTILVLESSATSITWNDPRDYDDISSTFEIGTDIGGCNARGMNVLMATGEVRFLPDSIAPETIKAMLTIDGNEAIPDY